MAINPIDTEVFVQNLKQAYTILRQNILICNTMVKMINNFNSLNTTGEQNASDISELQSQVASMDAELTQLNTDLDNLETKVNSNMSKTETAIQNITKDLTKKVTASDKQKIVYGTAVGSATPFEYKVLLSDEPDIQSSDRSIPTTAWVAHKVFTYNGIPNKTEFVTQKDGTYALELKNNERVLYTDTSINDLYRQEGRYPITFTNSNKFLDLTNNNKHNNLEITLDSSYEGSSDTNINLGNFIGVLYFPASANTSWVRLETTDSRYIVASPQYYNQQYLDGMNSSQYINILPNKCPVIVIALKQCIIVFGTFDI